MAKINNLSSKPDKMIRIRKSLNLSALQFITTLLLVPNLVCAEKYTAVFNTSQEIKSGFGVVLTKNSFNKFPSVNITRTKADEVILSFEASGVNKSDYISAMGITESGEIIYSNLSTPTFNILPKVSNTCIPRSFTPDSIYGKQSYLFSLLEIRGERRKLLREQLAIRLKSHQIKELNNLERVFGLTRSQPISAETPIFELVDRLSRLELALKAMSAE